ncbi:MAG: T9SS type A sorting domain-containing protein [Bacteroidetes bacterium]|nr:T9SS type A sorting domain-containing protein [Bacteroidota bacterium]
MRHFYFLLVFAIAANISIKAQAGMGITNYPTTITGASITPLNMHQRSAFVIDSTGNKWIGFSFKNANSFQLLRYNGTQWDTFPAFTALSPSNQVYALAVDAANNLWIGSNIGLTKYNGSTFTTYNTANSALINDTVISIACSGGMVYAGTHHSGLSVFNGTSCTNYNISNGLQSNYIGCITAENPNAVWIGNQSGLQKFDGTAFTFYNVVPSTTVTVNCIYVDAWHNKWLGTFGSGVIKYDGTHFYPVQQLFSVQQTQDSLGMGHFPLNVGCIFTGPKGGAAFMSCNELINGKFALGCTHEVTHTDWYSYNLPGGYASMFAPTSNNNNPTIAVHDKGSHQIFFTNLNSSAAGAGAGMILYSYDYTASTIHAIDPSNSNSQFLDINNINAMMTPNSQIHCDVLSSTTKYFTSKQKMQSPVYNSAFWIGGYDNSNNLRMAAMTYRQNGYDFWPGPLDSAHNANIDSAMMMNYNRVWKINRFDVANFMYNWAAGNVQSGLFTPPADFITWPGNSPYPGQTLAPYVDVNHDGHYNCMQGDYPLIKGDQMIWWVFNDNANKHTETGSAQNLGVEVQASAYAYTCPGIADSNKVLNNTTFYDYKIYNRSANNYNQTYMDLWVDSDLGYYLDDYIGCDVMNNFGYTYNGENWDPDYDFLSGYHSNLPVFSCNVLTGPLAYPHDGVDNNHNYLVDEPGEQCLMSNFTYYSNTGAPLNGTPFGAQSYYNLMAGVWESGGVQMTYGNLGFTPVSASNPVCKYLYPYDSDPYGMGLGGTYANPVATPTAYPNWAEFNTPGDAFGDRRFMLGVGPFSLPAYGSTELNYAYVFTQDSAACMYDTVGGFVTEEVCLIKSAKKDNQRIKRWFDNNDFPSCLNLNSVGIQKIKEPSLSLTVYPNPASTNLYVHFSEPQQNATIEVFDMLGNVVGGYQYPQLNGYAVLPVSSLASGVYFIRAKSNQGIYSQKFVKE